eukprot:g13921.t1
MAVEPSGSRSSEINKIVVGSPLPADRSKRRGSVLRREALERLQHGTGGPGLDEDGGVPLDVRGRGVPSAALPIEAWGREEPPAQPQPPQKQHQQQQHHQQKQHHHRRRNSSKHDLAILKKRMSMDGGNVAFQSPSVVSKVTDLYGHGIGSKGATFHSAAAAAAVATAGGKAVVESGSSHDKASERTSRRAEAAQERRIRRRRESSLRLKDLEQMSVEKVGDTARKLYVPPLGPLDDPAGVIYLDGNLTEKTVDSRVLDSVGEGIHDARKELYDLGTRRRTLVEEIRAQKIRGSLGFPHNIAAESMLEKRAQDADVKRVETESKLKRLLDHRRRLFEVLKASCAHDDASVSQMSKVLRSELRQNQRTGGVDGGDPTRHRRSSLEDLKGWREVIEAVFSEEADRRRQVVLFREGSGEDDRERKESSIRGFIAATTPKEHIEFLTAALDPARAQDLSAVVKCLLLHYTGPAADELDILLGGRIGGVQAQELLEMTLVALDTVHANHVPSILMLQWLLGRAPHLRSLLLGGGVIRRAFRRLEGAEAKGFGPGERALQYAALFLVVGLLIA